MAGLLDIFGTSGGDTMGLLGMSPEDIQKSKSQAQAQALFALAGRMFQGGRGGQSILEGIQQGQQAYNQAMQGGLQQQLQNAQLQEMLRKKKQEQDAMMRQQGIEQEIASAYRPKTYADTPLMNIMGQEVAGPNMPQEAGGGLEALAPKLMGSPEGRKSLADLLAVNKSMAGDTFNLAEGAQLGRINPITGKSEILATGAPKKEDIAGDVKEARQVLGIMTPVNEMTATERALVKAYIDRKDVNKSPKVAVDLKDPTAVAKAQADLLKDWRGVTKDTGSFEVADRFKAAQVAVEQGNAGNKSADGALIYSIAKVWDPTGSVMEGDKESIRGNRSLPQSIKAYAEKIFSGTQLLPEERAGLLSVTAGIVDQKAKNLEKQKAPYVNLAKQFGGTGDLLLNPLADVLQNKEVISPTESDIKNAAAAEIARRRKVKDGFN
jgi:hypothetical protein